MLILRRFPHVNPTGESAGMSECISFDTAARTLHWLQDVKQVRACHIQDLVLILSNTLRNLIFLVEMVIQCEIPI